MQELKLTDQAQEIQSAAGAYRALMEQMKQLEAVVTKSLT